MDVSASRGVSYRQGGASAMAAAGIPDSVIKSSGRWAGSSYLRYIKLASHSDHRLGNF
jgi:hypothetical protein